MPLSEEERAEVLEELRTTREALKGIPDRLDAIEHKGDHTRWLVVAVAAVVAALVIGFLWDRTNEVAAKSDNTSNYLVAACQQANSDRASELGFWLGLLEDSRAEKKNQTSEARKGLDAYEAEFRDVYGQRDCEKVRDGEVVKTTPGPTATPVPTPAK